MRRLLPVVVLALLALPRPAAAGFEVTLERLDKAAARKLERIGEDALEAGAGATARRILERALSLYPENTRLRTTLGFRREGSEWVRDPEEETRIRLLEDADGADAAAYRERAREAEEGRARSLARAAEGKELTPEIRALLLACLDRAPREEEVHRVLGHEEIDGVWVRPELVPTFRRRAAVFSRWAGIRDAAASAAVEALDPVRMPGAADPLPRFRVGARTVASVFAAEPTRLLVRDTVAVHALLRDLFPEGPVYDPPDVYFLDLGAYREFVTARVADEARRKRLLSLSACRGTRFLAVRALTPVRGRDIHAHLTGFISLQFMASPPDPEGEEGDIDATAWAWLKEGVGYLLSLELYDTAETWFVSHLESSGKLRHVVPPPEVKTTKSLTAWLRAHLLDGAAWPVAEVFGKTLNNLDLLASVEAWSFVRFLAVYDPAALAKLPSELRAEESGAFPDRADRALRATFGADTATLERLWRAWVQEIP